MSKISKLEEAITLISEVLNINEKLVVAALVDHFENTSDENDQILDELSFIDGAKWQSQRMYTEEDLEEAFENGVGSGKYQQEYGTHARGCMTFQEWFEQFKKI